MEFVLKILKGLANQGFLIGFFIVLVIIYCRLAFGYLKSNETEKVRSALKGIIFSFVVILILLFNLLVFYKGGPLA